MGGSNGMVRIAAAVLLAAAAVTELPAARGATETANAASPADSNPVSRGEAAIARGLDFLKTQQQSDAGWQAPADPPGLTAIVLKAFAQDSSFPGDSDILHRGFDRLLSYQKPDGSITNETLYTYNTAIAISAMAVSKNPAYHDAEDKALAFLRQLQWTDKIQGVPDQSRRVDPKNVNYGGFGYGRSGRADNSNLQTALDALHDAGLKSDDPAFQAALKFVTRSQNNSETNDQPWAGDDGGFIYTPADGGSSAAGSYTGPDGRKMFRSYGSMTYAGLKSMMYAGLSKDDPRVKAAWNWIRGNWTLNENPGMQDANPAAADSGLFYYYHTLARALRAYGEPVIVDTKGGRHDWRVELIDKLASMQKPDGSWRGTARWMENKPVLSTTFGILSLEEAEADLKDHPAGK